MSYWKQREIVEKFKGVKGEESKEIPREIIQLEADIKRVGNELASLRLRGAPEPEIGLRATELGSLEYRYRQLLIAHDLGK